MGSTSVIERAAEEREEYKSPEPPNVPNIAASPYALNTPANSKAMVAEDRQPYGTEQSHPDGQHKQPSPIERRSKEQLRKDIREVQRKMQLAAKEMDFMAAARFRDEIKAMQAALDDARGD